MKSHVKTARLKQSLLKVRSGSTPLNWLFIPGGPGIDASCFDSLTSKLKLKGSIYYFKIPPSNKTGPEQIRLWKSTLMASIKALEPVVIFAHSFGGMLTLSSKINESNLRGIVLCSTAPDRLWEQKVPLAMKKIKLGPNLEKFERLYKKEKTNNALTKLWVEWAPFYFTKKNIDNGRKYIKSLYINTAVYETGSLYFLPKYSSKWVPANSPTWIIAGSEDLLTPVTLFKRNRNFRRKNIRFLEIKHAGHFPWVEDFRKLASTLLDIENSLMEGNFS